MEKLIRQAFTCDSARPDELILDFGVDAHHPTPNGPEPIVLSQRLVLTWSNAERLARMLHDLIQHHNKSHVPHASTAGARPSVNSQHS